MDAHALAQVQEDHTHLSRTELLKTLVANRDAHVAEYNKAIVGWRAAYVTATRKRILDLNTIAAGLAAGDDVAVADRWDAPEKPVSYKSAYDKIIKRMEMSKDESIYLTHSDFDKYVMDVWSWSGRTQLLSQLYNG